MFCVLLRGGVVSALYEMRLLVSSLVSISLTFIPLLRVVFMARSFAPVVCQRKFHGKGIKFAKSRDHPQWRSGYVRSGQSEGTGFKSR